MTTLFFYDLETSGFSPRSDRIMQFGGQRTDMQLKPVGEPFNILIKISDDILPSPDAVLVTGITPQKTLADGVTEAEFLKIFHSEIAVPDTVFVGFNSVRFDDEFMRFLNWRNFYDAYEWQWKDGRGRWDLLDMIRMTRALRPNGIKWPVSSEGKPGNRLESLASVNGLVHDSAHDALSDVMATIGLAQLVKKKQPKLFDYLLDMRSKAKVGELVEAGQPFVYSSGKYGSDFGKTTVAAKIGDHPKKKGGLVFDLRFDPEKYVKLEASRLVELWQYDPDRTEPSLPVKTILYNRCPAVAPLAVLDSASQKRISIDLATVQANYKKLQKHKDELMKKLTSAVEVLDKKQQARFLEDESTAESALYDGFVGGSDKKQMQKIIETSPEDISSESIVFSDQRLEGLILPYKARNFYKNLSNSELEAWEKIRHAKLLSAKFNIDKYMKRIEELASQPKIVKNDLYLLEELRLYGEAIVPEFS